MNQKLIFATVFLLSSLNYGCGGGSSPSSSTSSNDNNSPNGIVCDMDRELAMANRTGSFLDYPPIPTDPTKLNVSEETWILKIQGQFEQIRVIIVRPARIKEVGVVFFLHGHSEAGRNASTWQMRSFAEYDFADRGYVSVYVGRRGYYGSSGDWNGNPAIREICAKGKSIECTRLAWEYTSADMIAALEYASKDGRLGGLLNRTILIGASGGSDTAIYTASSDIFKSITNRAVIRLNGTNSRDFETLESYQQAYWQAQKGIGNKGGGESLWLVGDKDSITSPRYLACEFKAYNDASGRTSSFVVVPGWDHGNYRVIFSTNIYPTVASYLSRKGFPGF